MSSTAGSTPSTTIILRGSCFCGGIQYTSSTLPTDVAHCHCISCRQISGSAFIPFANFPISSIVWLSRRSLRALRSSDFAKREFCSECGSTISMMYDIEPEGLWIAVGTIDEKSVRGGEASLRARKHIYAGEGKKAGWFDIPMDGIDRTDGFTAGFETKIKNGVQN